ncbi:MAG: class I SAM-dependent methyltransferase [Bacteroidetes bacterium]|nr:class I SAM-dependent methyltransferase [Bacteroidota bacterium]
MIKSLINSVLKSRGYKLEKIRVKKTNAEGYPAYLEEAEKMGIDVNEYLNGHKGWIKPLPVLEESFFPFVREIKSPKILELGPGTGRWSVYILEFAKKLNCSEYNLVDHSPWFVDFLSKYFSGEEIVKTTQNNGVSLPFDNGSFDVIFSQGVLPELKPPSIYLYAKEFSRVLKKDGICVFDYFTYDSDEGWEYFIRESNKGNLFYTYYTDALIDKIFSQEGFTLVERFTYSKSKFPVYRKT